MKAKIEDTNYLLFTQFFVIVIAGVVVTALAWQVDWVREIIAKDNTYLCRAIIFFVLAAGISIGWKTFKLTKELNIARKYIWFLRKAKNNSAYERIEAGDSRLAQYLEKIKGLKAEDRYSMEHTLERSIGLKIANAGNNLSRLTTAGIIVTVIGMMLFLGGFGATGIGIDPKIGDILKNTLPGLHLATAGTLLGGIGFFWLGWLFEILENIKEQLVIAIIEAGVYRAQT